VGGRTDRHDETNRRAVNKRQDNKLKNCCIWLVMYLNLNNRRSSRLMQSRLKKSVSTGCMVVCDGNILTYLLAYLLTYLLTQCSRVLLEKLTALQLVKKFPAFYETRRFITALTTVRHLYLSSARSIQSIPPHPTS